LPRRHANEERRVTTYHRPVHQRVNDSFRWLVALFVRCAINPAGRIEGGDNDINGEKPRATQAPHRLACRRLWHRWWWTATVL